MKFNLNRLFAVGLTASLLFFNACNKDSDDPKPIDEVKTSEFVLEFDHVWGPNGGPFAIGQELTHPASAEKLTFTKLAYYISNVVLIKADNTEWKEKESYHLVDAATAASGMINIKNVPTGDYKAVRFSVGVDSTRNVSGAQTGALSTTNGMFWSWNTGYIFVKAEGMSPQSSSGGFTYHLGGFREVNSAIVTKEIAFGSEMLSIKPNAKPQVHLYVNAARFWHGGLSVAQINFVHMPGANAITFAKNFAGGIMFDHIHN